MEYIILLFLLLPFVLSAAIAKDRNRSITKSLFITLFFSWFATVGLWLALKTRKGNSLF